LQETTAVKRATYVWCWYSNGHPLNTDGLSTILTTGPLLPYFSGELPQLLIKPAAVATGVGLACNILFFPQSPSHVALDGMQGLLAPMNGFLEASLLSLKNPSERMNLKHLMKVKSQIVGAHQALGLSMKFLPLDASRGKWSAGDISNLKDSLRQLVVMFLGLLQLQISREEVRTRDEQLVSMIEALHSEKDEKASRKVGHHYMNKAADFRLSAREPQAKELIEKTLLSLAESCGPLFNTCRRCIMAINEGLRESNASRWFHRSSPTQVTGMRNRQASLLDELEKANESFIIVRRKIRKSQNSRVEESSPSSPADIFKVRPEISLVGLL
jgi:hypothetical protein